MKSFHSLFLLCFSLLLPLSISGQENEAFPVIKLGTVAGVTAAEMPLLQHAVADLNTVLKSPQFRTAVLEMRAKSKDGYSNQQIYDLLVSKSPLSVNVTFFDGDDDQNTKYHTEGYEDASSPSTCFVNRYFVKQYDGNPGFLASLMLHESMHILGFVHHEYWYKHSSVPYTMNYIYDDVAPKLGLPGSEGGTKELEKQGAA